MAGSVGYNISQCNIFLTSTNSCNTRKSKKENKFGTCRTTGVARGPIRTADLCLLQEIKVKEKIKKKKTRVKEIESVDRSEIF